MKKILLTLALGITGLSYGQIDTLELKQNIEFYKKLYQMHDESKVYYQNKIDSLQHIEDELDKIIFQYENTYNKKITMFNPIQEKRSLNHGEILKYITLYVSFVNQFLMVTTTSFNFLLNMFFRYNCVFLRTRVQIFP
jgi:hypothetical protein